MRNFSAFVNSFLGGVLLVVAADFAGNGVGAGEGFDASAGAVDVGGGAVVVAGVGVSDAGVEPGVDAGAVSGITVFGCSAFLLSGTATTFSLTGAVAGASAVLGVSLVVCLFSVEIFLVVSVLRGLSSLSSLVGVIGFVSGESGFCGRIKFCELGKQMYARMHALTIHILTSSTLVRLRLCLCLLLCFLCLCLLLCLLFLCRLRRSCSDDGLRSRRRLSFPMTLYAV